LLHVLGFAVPVLPHALVILLSLAPLPLAVSFACLWCFLGNLLHDWHTPDQIQHRMLDGNIQVLSTTWRSRRICCCRSTGLCLSRVRGRSLACALIHAREVCVASSSVLFPPPALRSPHTCTCTHVLTCVHTRMHSEVRRGAGASGLPGILDMRFVSSTPDDGPSPSACTRDLPALAQSTFGRPVLPD